MRESIGRLSSLFLLSLLLFLPGHVFGANERVTQSLKLATAFLQVPETGSSGTAFCISTEGYFLTCAHVIDGIPEGKTVTLTINSGQKDQKQVEAEIIRSIPSVDLALLKAPKRIVPPLKLGNSSDLKETEEIFVAGFPFGKLLDGNGSSPTVSIATGKITSLRRGEDSIQRVQFDATLNPGNSGGPVINSRGQVVGVAVSTIFRSGLNFGIATDVVNGFIASPKITLATIKPIAYADRSKPFSFDVSLNYLAKFAAAPKFTATFEGSGTEGRKATVKRLGNHRYRITGIPIPSNQASHSGLLRIDLISQNGRTRFTNTFRILDRDVTIGDTKTRLSKLNLIAPARGWVRGHNGKELNGPVTGLDAVSRVMEDREQRMSVENYDLLILRPDPVGQESVSCSLKIQGSNYILARQFSIPITEGVSLSGQLSKTNTNPFDIEIPELPDDKDETVEIPFGAEAYDITLGGGGRYLVAQLHDRQKFVLIDCLARKEIGRISTTLAEPLFTAGAKELLIASGNMVERWDLETGKRTAPAARWMDGKILALAAGPGSSQHVALHYDALTDGKLYQFEIRDQKTGALRAIEPIGKRLARDIHMRASFDGLTFSHFQNPFGSSHGSTTFVSGRGLSREDIRNAGWIRPGVDGSICYTYLGKAERRGYAGGAASLDQPMSLLPTSVRGLATGIFPRPEQHDQKKKPTSLGVLDVYSNRILTSNLSPLPEFDATAIGGVKISYNRLDPLTWDKRFYLCPQLDLLITIPPMNQKVVIRRFDVWEKLRSAGKPFLFVTTLLPVGAPPGSFSLDLKAETSEGQPEFEIIQGPSGFQLSKNGQITWEISPDLKGTAHTIILRVTGNNLERIVSHEIVVQ